MCSTTAYDFSGLSNISLFRNLSHAQLTQLSERLHGNVYPAGTTLMTVEQPGEVVYFIRQRLTRKSDKLPACRGAN